METKFRWDESRREDGVLSLYVGDKIVDIIKDTSENQIRYYFIGRGPDMFGLLQASNFDEAKKELLMILQQKQVRTVENLLSRVRIAQDLIADLQKALDEEAKTV